MRNVRTKYRREEYWQEILHACLTE